MTDDADVAAWLGRLTVQLGRLTVQLERLAAPGAAQVAYLRELGVSDLADELALEFDDVYRPALWRLEATGASPDVLAALRSVDEALRHGQLDWSAAALAESPQWAEIRRISTHALTLVRSMQPRPAQ